jgi:hypothetical protein
MTHAHNKYGPKPNLFSSSRHSSFVPSSEINSPAISKAHSRSKSQDFKHRGQKPIKPRKSQDFKPLGQKPIRRGKNSMPVKRKILGQEMSQPSHEPKMLAGKPALSK